MPLPENPWIASKSPRNNSSTNGKWEAYLSRWRTKKS